MIPQTPDIMPSPLCYEGDTRNILEDTPLGTNQLSYKLGFPPITSVNVKAGGIAPSRVDMNAALKLLSIHTYFVQSGNKYKYSNLLDYKIGSTVLGSDNALYYCIQANGATSPNTVQDPVSSTGYWVKIIDAQGVFNINIIADGAVSTAKIANNAVTNSKIKDGAVTQAKLASSVVGNLPIGFIYFQLRGQSTPDVLFGTSSKWQDISATYAGEFFRAVGGNSAAFGSKQNEGLPNITANWGETYLRQNKNIQPSGAATGSVAVAQAFGNSTVTSINSIGFNASYANTIYGSSTHVTPYNSAIRIWKKIS